MIAYTKSIDSSSEKCNMFINICYLAGQLISLIAQKRAESVRFYNNKHIPMNTPGTILDACQLNLISRRQRGRLIYD